MSPPLPGALTDLAPTDLAPTDLAPTDLAPTDLAPTDLAPPPPPPSAPMATPPLHSRQPAAAAKAPAVTLQGDHMSDVLPGQAPPGASLLTLPTLNLDCGLTVHDIPLAYSTYGTLNQTADNCILVGHSLTSNSVVADWWPQLLGPGPAFSLDTSRYFIVCINYIASPYGSYSPLTPSAAGRPSGSAFPAVTLRDNTRAMRGALELLGVRAVAVAVGGSMGGMLALQFAAMYPESVGALVCICGAARHKAWQIGINEAQRAAVFADAGWDAYVEALDAAVSAPREGEDVANGDGDGDGDGDGGIAALPKVRGLGAARMQAMLSYRAAASFNDKFPRTPENEAALMADEARRLEAMKAEVRAHGEPAGAPPIRNAMSSYLRYQGHKFMSRFDAMCYVAMSYTLDSHDVPRDARSGAVGVECPSLIVAVDSDSLYPLDDQRELADGIPGAELHIISSPHGHDSFLIEIDSLNRRVSEFMAKQKEPGR